MVLAERIGQLWMPDVRLSNRLLSLEHTGRIHPVTTTACAVINAYNAGVPKPIGPMKSLRERQKESPYAGSQGLSHFQEMKISQSTMVDCCGSVLVYLLPLRAGL